MHILRKRTLEYLGTKGRDACNLLSSDENMCECVCCMRVHAEGEYGKAHVNDRWVWVQVGVSINLIIVYTFEIIFK